MENGYTKEEVEQAMKEKERRTDENEEDEPTRGMVVIQNIPGFTPQFNKIAREHNFKVANKTGKIVKDLTTKAKTPLGDKNKQIVYNIPCKYHKHAYTGETDRN